MISRPAGERQLAVSALQAQVASFDWSRLTETRRHVLEAFLVLAAQHGYPSVTMRDLGAAVSVKAPSLYKHFRNGREEVVREALRWPYHRFAVAVLGAVENTSVALDFWDALVGEPVWAWRWYPRDPGVTWRGLSTAPCIVPQTAPTRSS